MKETNRLIDIRTTHSQYFVHIGALPQITHNAKVLIVSNPKVSGLYMQKILPLVNAPEVYVCTVPDGEAYKTMKYIESILECAFLHKLNRKSLMIALGGGVIGDMVGFASGIFERGIDFIQIPSTILAQVDASVGGKTGVNNVFGKNLVGLFHQPKAVYIDTSMLLTLHMREFGAGIAEMIKIAVCFDKTLFDNLRKTALEAKDSALIDAIARCVELKANIVNADETEQGIRATLNYGHTFGHVIENLTQYKHFLHGEAVSIGMCIANALACELGLLSISDAKDIKNALALYGLPTYFEIGDINAFYHQCFLDKKALDKQILFVLPNGIGKAILKDDIPKAVVLKALQTFKANKG